MLSRYFFDDTIEYNITLKRDTLAELLNSILDVCQLKILESQLRKPDTCRRKRCKLSGAKSKE